MTQQQLAELMARIMGDREQMVYTVRYITKRGLENESSCGVRGITENLHGVSREGA